MKLKVLGCGDAFASEGRFNTSFLITAEGEQILLDCGASTLIRLKQEKINPLEIDQVVITHFHGDHYGGLPFFIISNAQEGERKKPLTIWGPKDVEQRIRNLQNAMYPGTEKLIDQLNIEFVEFSTEQYLTKKNVSVFAQPVIHAPLSHPHGVKIKIGEKVLGFSGDTSWTDTLTVLAVDTDLFICECNDFENEGPAHLSYQTIQSKLDLLPTKKLILSHMGSAMIHQSDLELECLEEGREYLI